MLAREDDGHRPTVMRRQLAAPLRQPFRRRFAELPLSQQERDILKKAAAYFAKEST